MRNHGLRTLLRLARWRLDEARKALAEKEQRLALLWSHDGELARRLERERMQARDAFHQESFAAFAARIKQERHQIAEQARALEAEIEAERDELRDLFAERKRIEILAERRAAEEEAALAREEQAMFDEVGLRRHEGPSAL